MTKLPLLMHHYGARRGVGCVSGRFNIFCWFWELH